MKDDLGNECTSNFIIYGLFDPETQELRYIGKSVNGLKRSRQHTKTADLKRHGKTHKVAWVKSLIKKNLKPIVMIITQCGTPEELYPEEQRLIKRFKTLGAKLTNATDGGPGRYGYKLSEATKAKLRKCAKAQTPVRHTKTTKEKLRTLQLGRTHSEEHRLNMAKAHGAKPFIEVSTGMRFDSQSQAARAYNTSQTNIRRVLVGERKAIHGIVFKYL